ncbi:MAG: glycogen/starch/alpha-glucan phosphorylase, partial [Stellaceae bacterium]
MRERLIEHSFGGIGEPRARGGRRVYYLSMEFLPGRIILYALRKLGLYDAVAATLAEHGLALDEIAELEADPALGNGGLGRLAACLMDSMANLDVPAIGYGIRYDCGLFTQQIDNGWQVERPERWLERGHPWEIARRELLYPVRFGGYVADGPGDTRSR